MSIQERLTCYCGEFWCGASHVGSVMCWSFQLSFVLFCCVLFFLYILLNYFKLCNRFCLKIAIFLTSVSIWCITLLCLAVCLWQGNYDKGYKIDAYVKMLCHMLCIFTLII